VLVVYSASAVHSELGLLFVKCKCNRDKLVLVVAVAVVARHYNTCIANLYLRPSTFSNSVNAEQTVVSV
jgi:hypothetical protein